MNIVIAPVILWIPLLLVGLLILLLVKAGTVGRWILGIGLLLTGLFFLSVIGVRVGYRDISGRAKAADRPSDQAAAIQTVKDPIVWNEGMEEELTPTVYSSLSAAAYGLGVQLQETLSVLPQPPKQIVLPEQPDLEIAVLEQLRRGLKFILPDVPVVIGQPSSEPGQLRIMLAVKDCRRLPIRISETHNGKAPEIERISLTDNQYGLLEAVVQTADNKFVQQVRFDHRVWLSDPERFGDSMFPGQWAVIASDQTAVSKEQAAALLMQSGADFVRRQIETTSPAGVEVHPGDLQQYGCIVDEYFQQFQGLSGPIWRGALLLEVSPDRLQRLCEDKAVVLDQTRRTWAWQILSLLGMLALISLLYAIINAITKGYYSVLSAVVAIGLLVIFVLFLFYV